MTISTTTRKVIGDGNGVTTAFDFAFQVRGAADLQIYYTDDQGVVTGPLATNLYSVVLNPIPSGQLWSNGGTVTYPTAGAAIATGTTLTIVRNVAELQSTALTNQGGYYADSVEQALDVLTMIAQEISEAGDRALTIPITSEASTELPFPVANAVFGWNAAGTAIVNVASPGSIPLPLSIANGGTGASTPATARAALGPPGINEVGLSPMVNGTIAASVAGSALTISVKTADTLADPSATDPVVCAFREPIAGLQFGDYFFTKISAPLSLTVSSGSTLGASNGVPFRAWIVLIKDNFNIRLGVVNCLLGTSVRPLSDDKIVSSTAEGGAGGADSAQVIYTDAATTNKAMRVVGYLEYSSGLTAAGTYDVVPTKLQLFGGGVQLPGQLVQTARTDTGAVATGTTIIVVDDTIPQNTEGDQYMAQAITPTSAVNLLRVRAAGLFTSSSGSPNGMLMALFRDTVANASASAWCYYNPGVALTGMNVSHTELAASASATTFKIRAGAALAGTVTFNGIASARLLGGVMNAYIEVEEIMA